MQSLYSKNMRLFDYLPLQKDEFYDLPLHVSMTLIVFHLDLVMDWHIPEIYVLVTINNNVCCNIWHY